MDDCVFCKIVAGTLPAKLVYSDDLVVAFEDLNPQAPLHVVVVPREHVAKLADLEDPALGGRLLMAARRVARLRGNADDYRVVVNNGAKAGQSVWHLHLHVLAGRQFTWPPG